MFVAFTVLAMHYLGIHSIYMQVDYKFDMNIVLLSVLVALVAATAAMFILFRVIPYYRNDTVKVIGYLIIAFAVNGMHYAGMAGLQYTYAPNVSFSRDGRLDGLTFLRSIVCVEIVLKIVSETFIRRDMSNVILVLKGRLMAINGTDDARELRRVPLYDSIQSEVRLHILGRLVDVSRYRKGNAIVEEAEVVAFMMISGAFFRYDSLVWGPLGLRSKIVAIEQKIEIEKMTQQGARHLLPNLPDEILNEQCRHVIAESEKRAQFLRAELHKLQIRKNTITGDEEALNYQGGFSTIQFERGRTRSDPQTSLMRRSCASDDCQHEPVVSLDRRNIRKFIAKRKESRGVSIHTTVSSVEPEKLTCQQVASDFDFLRSESRITREKIKYKLAEVEQKLDIEQKVQAGIERLWKVMEQQPQTNGANRQYQVEEKLIECQSKMILLSKSRQWYKSLDLADNDLPSLPN
ncbi:hypothetical protein HDU80_002586, partial [Chytriomyces hyalinus]